MMVQPQVGDVGKDRRMDGDGTGDTVMGQGIKREAPPDLPRVSQDREGDGCLHREDSKEVVCGDTACADHCHCQQMDFISGIYPRIGKDALIQRIDTLDNTTSGIFDNQTILDTI